MQLNSLKLINFRCFENVCISFNNSVSVLVGVNASGKSTILNAASIAIGSFLLGIDGASSKSITPENIRHTTYRSGTLLELESQYPVIIQAQGILHGKEISWERTVNSSRGRTTKKGASQIESFASSLQKRVKEGRSDTVLPLLAYYGTDRVASLASLTESTKPNTFSRFSGYTNCLDPRSSERHLIYWMKKLTYSESQNNRSVPELKSIKKAVLSIYNSADERFAMPRAVDFRYSISDERLEFVLDGHNQEKSLLPYTELSDGYRSIIGLVADISRRMGTLNPQLSKTGEMLKAPGVVLIDEIDQHLHPAWQQHIIKDLRDTFENVQFIVTTHSPSIINSVNRESIIILGEDGVHQSPSIQTYGRDANSILEYVMGALPRPTEISEAFNTFFDLLDNEKFLLAKEKLNEIESQIGQQDPDVTKARVLLDLEMLN